MTTANGCALLRVALTVACLLLAGWGTFFLLVAPQHIRLGTTGVFGIGLAMTAFLLGVRHAFDPDHIAAIDNTTRRLITADCPSTSVGLWFALGHSTIVVVTVVLLTAGVRPLARQLLSSGGAFAATAGFWGLLVAGTYLLVVGTSNFGTLRRLVMRSPQAASGVGHAHPAGVMSFVTRRLGGRIDRPWKMYPIGLLFGLGFDTASTVGLLVLGGGLTASAPWYAALAVPLLFTAGMCTFDALNGVLMNRAYCWSDGDENRRRHYGIVVTGISVFVALGIGMLSLTGAATAVFDVQDGPLAAVANLNIDDVGFVIVGLLLVVWGGQLFVSSPIGTALTKLASALSSPLLRRR